MPSFDTLLEPDMVAIRHAVENTQKQIGTRFDFKGTSAAVEFKEKDKQIQVVGDSDFQLDQINEVLIGQLTKQKVSISFLEMADKVEKMGGDKVRKTHTVKAGIETELAKKVVTALKNSKLKVQASIQGDTVRITGKNRDDLQTAIALLRKDFADQPFKYDNFRD